MSAHERTAYWVQTHSSNGAVYYSPSIPPSDIDGYLSSPPSDAGSSHSIPPRMILRYEDGRPDIPISHAERYGRHGGRGYDTVDPRSYYDARHRGRQHNTSYANPPFVDVQSRRHDDGGMFNAPEQIRVLPAATSHSVPRSRSLPRSYDPAVGPVPQTIHPLPPSGSYVPVSHPYQRSPRHSRPEGQAYASSTTGRAPYQPVNGFHHPPHIGPNSVIYSHSAPPVLMRQGHPSATAHTRTGVPEHRRGIPDAHMEMGYSASSRARAVSMSGRRPGSKALVVDRSDESSSDSEGDTSYYATRSRGKTPISTPSIGKSVATATSSGMSPVTPTSAIYGKRPFFQRLFGFAGKFSHTGPSRASSVADAGDLHRRHSISGSRR